MFTPESLFSEIIKDLSEQSSPVAVNSWAPYTRAIAIKDGNLVLVADNDMIFGFISRQWLERINASLNDLTSEHLTVTLLNGKAEEISWRAQRDDMAFGGYTFERFIVGNSNRFAHAAAYSVSQNPALTYNPLFIYGQSGLGKTHLLYAITHRIKQNFPDYKVVYVKGEEFTNQMIDAISRNLNAEFREKYRSADVLLIDDIQFIAGREATQEEFFHTFNQLYENGKQIILASDLPPRDIKRLEERLRTRFECGVIADINPPDLELRTAIVKKKAQNLGVSLPDEVMEYIAENLNNNIRQLEGAVKRICAQCMLTGTPVSLDLAVRSISDQVVGSESVTVTIDKILAAVSSHYGLTVEDLKSRKRTSNIASARHVAIYMIKKLTDRSLPAIGRVFGRDHTTIINSIDAVEKKLASDSSFDSEVHELLRTVKKR